MRRARHSVNPQELPPVLEIVEEVVRRTVFTGNGAEYLLKYGPNLYTSVKKSATFCQVQTSSSNPNRADPREHYAAEYNGGLMGSSNQVHDTSDYAMPTLRRAGPKAK
jgi:hypothetical protein